ncbi:MAG: HD domain-containing protein [Promethearchaeota archaeon]
MTKTSFPSCLKITNDKLKSNLNNLIQQAEVFWGHSLFHHYTDHGIEHSKRIINILGKLLKGKSRLLNDIEKFILLGGIFFHDIGMQSTKFSGVEKETTELTYQDLENIRKIHHKTSAKMIIESIKDPDLDLGFNNFTKNFVTYIAKISEYHRELDLLKLEEKIADRGDDIRIRLLATLLRFADELDVDYQRIVMERLQLIDIPLESKLHWWSHHFVQSIIIDKGKITVIFRFPLKRKKQEKILNYFSQNIINKIERTFNEIYDILDGYGIRLHKNIYQKKEYKPENILEPLPEELLELLLEKVEIKREIDRVLPTKLAEVIIEEIKFGNLFNLEFDVNIRTDKNTNVEFSMRIENKDKKFLFKLLGERPSQEQLEIIKKVKKDIKDYEIICVQKSTRNSIENQIFSNNDESAYKLREIIKGDCS